MGIKYDLRLPEGVDALHTDLHLTDEDLAGPVAATPFAQRMRWLVDVAAQNGLAVDEDLRFIHPKSGERVQVEHSSGPYDQSTIRLEVGFEVDNEWYPVEQ